MSTVTRGSTKVTVALPAVGGGETSLGLLTIAIGFLALIAKFSRLFA